MLSLIGIINLVLIDEFYADSIQKACHFTQNVDSLVPQGASFSWANFLGQRFDLVQFLQEVTLTLPPN